MFNESSLYQEILDSLQDGIYFVDRLRVIAFWNVGAERISGYSRLQVLGKACYNNILMHIDEEGNSLCMTNCPLAHTMEDGQPRDMHLYLHHADGTRIPIWSRVAPLRTSSGEITGAVEIFSDRPTLAGSFDRVQDLERMAAVDPQMNIANRRYSETHINARLEEARRFGVRLGMLMIGLDNFHRVSQTYGREIGARVMQMVAGTLLHNLRPFDFIGRWDSEEIVVLFSNIAEESLVERAESLRMLVESSFLMVGKPIRVTVSVGGTFFRLDDDLESWIYRAHRLLERSRSTGKNRVTLE
jgi:diguanylate cyclase (GGDEF)-like protein/PAS domain S-box-containing protein